MKLGKEQIKLLKDKSDFSSSSIKREWDESLSVEFNSSLLNPTNTSFFQKMNHPTKTRTLQINFIPTYPPLECGHKDCYDLADFAGFIIPGPRYPIPNYVGFPARDAKHRIGGTVTFVCSEHLSELISTFMSYRDAN